MENGYRKSVFVVVYRKTDKGIKYLILKRKLHWSGWEFPKGGINDNEEIINAVKRELKEETGQIPLSIQKHNFLGKYLYKKEFQDRGKIIGQTFSLYSAEVKNSEIVLDGREHSEYLWLSYPEAHKKLKYGNQKKCLEIVNCFFEQISKFRSFRTASGKLVLAGKDAKNNEELISQIETEENVFHTAKPGSPFVNIKLSKNETASQNDIKDSAIFCAAKSRDWRDNKSDVKVNWFKGKDILKIKGMKIGTFEVKNKKDILIKKQEVERFLKENVN
ncbi:MAG: NFACT RNA binding domain-containing protein [Nanoarchaeota archaeon]|nr:NFACT RNA binding domain-containing protein [Nanoarchaeota archaeon]